MDKVQLFIEIVTFIVLIAALFVNVGQAEKRKTAWNNFRVLAIAASIVGLIVYFRVLAQYSFMFLIMGILSISKKKKNESKQDNTINI